MVYGPGPVTKSDDDLADEYLVYWSPNTYYVLDSVKLEVRLFMPAKNMYNEKASSSLR